jgi:hypothetical protein
MPVFLSHLVVELDHEKDVEWRMAVADLLVVGFGTEGGEA